MIKRIKLAWLVYPFIIGLFLITTKGFSQQETLDFSHSTGFHGSSFRLTINCTNCTEIYWTKDGTEPNKNSAIVNGSLVIQKDLTKQLNLGTIPTTAVPNVQNSEHYITWQNPSSYPKAVPIRAIGFKGNIPITKVKTETYFFEDNWNVIPTFLVTLPPSSLFDNDTGIYIPGVHCDTNNSVFTGNYHQSGKKWERKTELQYFINQKVQFTQTAGIRIHGLKVGAAPQKSLRFYARKKYGQTTFLNSFFHSGAKPLKRFILRSPMSAHRENIITDIVITELARPLNLDIMDYNISNCYINGEYWGLHFVRERIDSKYISGHYQLDPDSIIIPGNYGMPAFDELFNFIETHDLSSLENYSRFSEMIDLDNFIDYVICETYFRNKDWLENNNNVRFWRHTNKGKWRLILLDLDAGFQHSEQDMFDYMIENKSSFISQIQDALIKNNNYKSLFLNRFSDIVNSHFSARNVHRKIDSISELIASQIPIQANRWHYPSSLFSWNNELDRMRSFANDRPEFVKEHLRKHFNYDAQNMNTTSEFYLSQIDYIVCGLLLLLSTTLIIFRFFRRKPTKK